LRRRHVTTDGTVNREDYDSSEVDWFAVYYDEEVYLVPFEEVETDQMSILLADKSDMRPCNQAKCRFAEDVLFSEQIERLPDE
jgi:hypothetical protein